MEMSMNPNGTSAEELAARRRAIQEQLKSGMANGDPIVVSPSGQVEFQSEANENGENFIQPPSGKLA